MPRACWAERCLRQKLDPNVPRRLFDTRARAAILRGVDTLADAVKVTLGPRCRNVVLDWAHGAPLITKDAPRWAPSLPTATPRSAS